MGRMKVAGLCLCAAFAMTSAFAGVASATPAFWTKAPIGAVAPTIPFKGTFNTSFLEGKVTLSKVTCTSGTVTGEVTGQKTTRNIAVLFKGCEAASFPCENQGVGSKEIKTDTLEGELGDVIALTRAGLRLFSQAQGPGGEFAAFTCASVVPYKVTGSVIGYFTPVFYPATSSIPMSLGLKFKVVAHHQQYEKLVAPAPLLNEQLSWEISHGPPELTNLVTGMTLQSVPPGNWAVAP